MGASTSSAPSSTANTASNGNTAAAAKTGTSGAGQLAMGMNLISGISSMITNNAQYRIQKYEQQTELAKFKTQASVDKADMNEDLLQVMATAINNAATSGATGQSTDNIMYGMLGQRNKNERNIDDSIEYASVQTDYNIKTFKRERDMKSVNSLLGTSTNMLKSYYLGQPDYALKDPTNKTQKIS